MELREYIQIIFRHMRVIIVFTAAALAVTMAVSLNQTPVYESIASFRTGINCTGLSQDDCVYAVEALTGRQRIFVTNCDIMESGLVREYALTQLNINFNDANLMDSLNLGDYTVDCTVLPESQVQLLVVQGTDPSLVFGLNDALMTVGLEELNRFSPLFPVTALDRVWFNPDPVSPNHVFNAVLGVALGVVVSITTVILLDYLKTPQEKLENISIYDPRINVYNSRYLQRRLNEEIQRSRMQHRLLAVALVHLTPDENFLLLAEDDQELLLRKAAERMRNVLRETDILAYRGNNTFGVMMPETSEQDALLLFKRLHELIREEPVETERYGYIINFTATTGMVENNGGTLELHETMEIVLDALQKAMSNGLNSIEFVRTKPSPFIMDETELEYVRYDLTSGGAVVEGNPNDPNKTQPLPPLSAITGNLSDNALDYNFGDYDEDISFDTPVPQAPPEPVERIETYVHTNHDDEDEVEDADGDSDDKEISDDSIATREERLLKERLVKRIRERQTKKKRHTNAN
jgi:diguanylate cyclase (GGDEF)-like protein